MYEGMTFGQLETAEKIPQGSIFPMGMGDGSGTKAVTQETLVKETGKALKIGDLAELQTEDKTSLVAAINEAAQSGGGGTPVEVDILDSKEEIEANTEPEKVAGALAVKEMFGALNDKLASVLAGIQSKRYSLTANIGNSGTSLTINETISIPSGYKAIGIIGWYISHPGWVSIESLRLSSNTVYAYMISQHTAYEESISVEVLLVKSSLA